MPRWPWQAGLLAAGTFAACEFARFAALHWAEVYLHTEFTLGYGPAGAVLAVMVPWLIAGLFFERRHRLLSNTRAARLGLGLITGGLVANLFEMVVFGGITDYISLGDARLSGGDVAAYTGGILLGATALFRAVRLYRRSQ